MWTLQTKVNTFRTTAEKHKTKCQIVAYQTAMNYIDKPGLYIPAQTHNRRLSKHFAYKTV